MPSWHAGFCAEGHCIRLWQQGSFMERFIGAHTVFNGGIHMAALRAGNAGMKALQIFTAPPQYYGDKSTMKPERVQRFHSALTEANIKLEHVVVHGAYVLNTATDDPTK